MVRCRAINLRSYDYVGQLKQLYEIQIKATLTIIYIHITGDSRAEQNIARARACNISYVPEGASPRRTYFRIARRAHRARVLYDFSARGSR